MLLAGRLDRWASTGVSTLPPAPFFGDPVVGAGAGALQCLHFFVAAVAAEHPSPLTLPSPKVVTPHSPLIGRFEHSELRQ